MIDLLNRLTFFKVLLLRQVDDFAIGCAHEQTAKTIYDIIGRKLQLPTESSPPFVYEGKLTDFNGLEIQQSREYITLSCTKYIDRVLETHGWTHGSPNETTSDDKMVPFHPDIITSLYKETGPEEGTPAHTALEDQCGFSF